jgi:hypothetical protein
VNLNLFTLALLAYRVSLGELEILLLGFKTLRRVLMDFMWGVCDRGRFLVHLELCMNFGHDKIVYVRFYQCDLIIGNPIMFADCISCCRHVLMHAHYFLCGKYTSRVIT